MLYINQTALSFHLPYGNVQGELQRLSLTIFSWVCSINFNIDQLIQRLIYRREIRNGVGGLRNMRQDVTK